MEAKIIHCFTSAVQQIKRHSYRELFGGFNQTHHQFPRTRDNLSGQLSTPKPSRLYLGKNPFLQANARSAMRNGEKLLHHRPHLRGLRTPLCNTYASYRTTQRYIS